MIKPFDIAMLQFLWGWGGGTSFSQKPFNRQTFGQKDFCLAHLWLSHLAKRLLVNKGQTF
jgi:hypothetical protein